LDHGDDAPIPDPYLSPRTVSSTPLGTPQGLPGDANPPPPEPPRGIEPIAAAPPETSFTPAAPPASPTPFQPVPGSPYATWALLVGVLGIICIPVGPALGVIAVVLSVLGWRQIGRSGGLMKGRLSAGLGMAAGVLSIVLFCALAAMLVLGFERRARTIASNGRSAQDPPASIAPGDDDQAAGQGTTTDPPATTSTVTTVGNITVVDVALGVSSLSSELRQQHAEASAHGERLLLETTSSDCAPCQGVATSLSDPRMQSALDHVRLVRVDREPFEEDLAELQIPSRPFPGFFLLDSDLRVSDGINGGEWDDDVAINIAPVLGPFVRGTYVKRRSPWKKLPRPGGTVL
jgi:hypothetical protein